MKRVTDKQVIVIAAISRNGVYAEDGKIPWHIKEDFEHFKALTSGHTVVMGKKTWESLPEKFRPLPNRDNIVVSTQQDYHAPRSLVVSSFSQALSEATTEKVFCIGGVRLWYEAMEIATDAWITRVRKEVPVIEGVTDTAVYLLTPHYKWEGFRFKGIQKPQQEQAKSEPYFEIFHWVR